MMPLRFSLLTDKPNKVYIDNPYIHETVVTDFQPFVAPESFKQPTQFADFGLSLNIYQIYKDYSNPNKKLIYEFTSAITTLTLPVVTNVTYRWGETISGVDYVTDVASGTAFTAGSTKRYVIVNSTDAIYAQAINQPVGIICLYVGKNTSRFMNSNNSYLKYVFLEDEKSITICPLIDSCSNADGVLTIPINVTAITTYAFRQTTKITKVIIKGNVADIKYYAFWTSPTARVYNSYPMVAPTFSSGATNSFGNYAAILHIKQGATGYDVAPWTNTAIFSQIIQDL